MLLCAENSSLSADKVERVFSVLITLFTIRDMFDGSTEFKCVDTNTQKPNRRVIYWLLGITNFLKIIRMFKRNTNDNAN
ncbi:hypothetical protein NBRC116591_31460 [Sessilibacter corallicola]|uniref:Uncharacterized protein n=1 Tax=Sessilibacter corallicola TaxID=2904075 RepID=A0ABQ0ACI6_9GAMM